MSLTVCQGGASHRKAISFVGAGMVTRVGDPGDEATPRNAGTHHP